VTTTFDTVRTHHATAPARRRIDLNALTADAGLLAIRATAGLVLAGHGAQKLFGWWHGPGFDFMVKSLGEAGYTPAKFFALLLGGTELVAGLLLALGLLTPLASAAVIGVMFNAIVGVHWQAGLWAPNGYELALFFGVAAVAIACAGPGRLSLDRHRSWVGGGATSAAVALGVGLGSALLVMAMKAL
jgi:putative oxidoreductase